MGKPIFYKLCRRWPMLALTSVVASGLTLGVAKLQSVVEAQLPGFLQTRLEAALGRRVTFGELSFLPTGLVINDFRVLRGGNEPVDPVTAKRLRVSLDWWHLITTQQVTVSAVDAERAAVRFVSAEPKPNDGPWTDQVLRLNQAGIARIGLRDASIQQLDAVSATPVWTAAGVDADVRSGLEQIGYRGSVRALSAPTGELANVSLSGVVNDEGLSVRESRATFQGGKLEAKGTLKPDHNDVLLTVQVKQLPLGRLATQLGIPEKWAVKGKVTGELKVNARDNSLQSIDGTLTVDRGELGQDGAVFPWRAASAHVRWTPEQSTFDDVKVTGDGVILTASGSAQHPAGQPFPEADFKVRGTLSAENGKAVQNVAEVLTFRQILDGRWSAARAKVDFQAHGKVGKLDTASANGHVSVDQLRFQPVPKGELVNVDRVVADISRQANRLTVKNVSARTDDLTLVGGATLTDGQGSRPGEFTAEGVLDAKNLRSLRKALPQSSLWRWAPVVSETASGRVTFRVGGPVGRMDQLRSAGRFEVREFRLSAQAPLPNGAVFFIPVDVASGDFRHDRGHLSVTNLNLDTATFNARGQLGLDLTVTDPLVDVALNLSTSDWRSLPAMVPTALPELVGGQFEGAVRVRGGFSQLAKTPITGWFRLTDAEYAAAREGASPLPVEELSAEFLWAAPVEDQKRVLELSKVKLASPLLTASGTGRLYPTDGKYHLALDVDATTEQAGELNSRFVEDLQLRSGQATAKLHLDFPMDEARSIRVAGTLALKDTTILHAVEPLGLKQIMAREARMEFSGGENRWELRSAHVDAEGIRAEVKGLVSPEAVDAEVTATVARWIAPEKLPVDGGALEVNGRLIGDPLKTDTLSFAGSVALDGAALRYDAEKLAVQGGTLKLRAAGEGQLTDVAQWVRSGQAELSGATVRQAGQPERRLDHVALEFQRDNDRYVLPRFSLTALGVRAEGNGEWSPRGHRLTLTAEVPTLDPFGFKLPEGIKVGGYHVRAVVAGTEKQPLQTAEADVELRDVRVAQQSLASQSFAQITGQARYADDRLIVTRLQAAGQDLKLDGHGHWARDGYQLVVSAQGPDLSKLGLPLPEGFGAQAFDLNATVSGQPGKKQLAAEGGIRLTNAVFPFGPDAPHRLNTASAQFRYDGSRYVLSDLKADGAAGQYSGTGWLTSNGFRVDLQSPNANPSLARWLVPGALTGGKLSGTLTLEGVSEGVKVASGRFEFQGGQYLAPDAMGLIGGPKQVRRVTGNYRWTPELTIVDQLEMDSELGTATGTLRVEAGSGQLLADLDLLQAGRAADMWPALEGKLQQATAKGKLDLRFTEAGAVHGTLRLQDVRGTLVLPETPEEYGVHPIEKGSGLLTFEPNKLKFSDVKLRGPKGNLDGNGVWTAEGGPVKGKGKAWFSREFTSKLIPSGWGWLAKLVGIRQIESDFTLSGTSDRVMLDADITHSLLWKFAKDRVPKAFQQIAAGKAPLWELPTDVAARPEPSMPEKSLTNATKQPANAAKGAAGKNDTREAKPAKKTQEPRQEPKPENQSDLEAQTKGQPAKTEEPKVEPVTGSNAPEAVGAGDPEASRAEAPKAAPAVVDEKRS